MENNELHGVETNNELENETIETNTGEAKDEQGESKDKQSESKDVKTDKDPKDEIQIPKSRLDEVQAKREAIEAEIAEIKAKLDAQAEQGTNGPEDGEDDTDEEFSARQAELNDMNQQLESLSKESKAKQQRIEEIETAIDEIAQSRIDTIPEAVRELVPDMDSLAQIAWIQKAESKGLFEPVPDRSKEPLGRKTNVGKAKVEDIVQAVGGSLGLITAGYNSRR